MIEPLDKLVNRYEGCCPHSKRLPLCGCGNPETAWVWVRDTLAAIDRKERWWEAYPDEGVQHILFGVLDDLDLVEHGAGWWGAWLTPEGRAVLSVLQAQEDLTGALRRVDEYASFCGGECVYCASWKAAVEVSGVEDERGYDAGMRVTAAWLA